MNPTGRSDMCHKVHGEVGWQGQTPSKCQWTVHQERTAGQASIDRCRRGDLHAYMVRASLAIYFFFLPSAGSLGTERKKVGTFSQGVPQMSFPSSPVYNNEVNFFAE